LGVSGKIRPKPAQLIAGLPTRLRKTLEGGSSFVQRLLLIIEQLRQRIERGSPREPYLQSGERVIVTEGSFAGLEAIFLAGDGDKRVMLLLNILRSEQRLSFPIGSVHKI
jgi:transcription antitermination factor NusG